MIISKKLLMQSTPSLVLSIIGLYLTGKWLNTAIKDSLFKKYPLLLISTCILAFKGNVELILAINLTTLSQSRNLSTAKFYRFALDNSCFSLVQSAIIGITVGFVACIKVILYRTIQTYIFFQLISICLTACIVSSMCVYLVMIIAVKLSSHLNIDPDNIVLPGVASFGDYFSVRCSIFFIRFFSRKTITYSIIFCACISLGILVILYFLKKSERLISMQTLDVLLITYIFSTMAGYLLEHFSKQYELLSIFEPVFCGMCGSTAYIYLNKKVTSLEKNTRFDRNRVYLTLIFISIIVSIIYTTYIYMFVEVFHFSIFAIFLMIYVLQAYLLLLLVDYLMKKCRLNTYNDLSVVTIPITTSVSDVLGTVFLIAMMKISEILS